MENFYFVGPLRLESKLEFHYLQPSDFGIKYEYLVV
jgi:hypothetical protein